MLGIINNIHTVMSTEQTGVVASLHERDWNGTMLYSFRLDGVDRYWRLGQVKPDFNKGDTIKFSEKNSNVDPQSVVVTDVRGILEEAKPVSGTQNVGVRMQYQAARADACRLVVAALHTDHLPHAANVAKGKRLDLLLGYIKQVTEQMLAEEEDHGKK